jgi:hypothetical protein
VNESRRNITTTISEPDSSSVIKDWVPSERRSLNRAAISPQTRRKSRGAILTDISEFHQILNTDPLRFLRKTTPQMPQLPEYDQAHEFDCHSTPEIMYALWWNMRAQETKTLVPENFLQVQELVNKHHRKKLVAWLADVQVKFNLKPETLFIAVNVLDRFTSRASVALDRYQLVGITALWVASKYEEIYPFSSSDAAYITDHAYDKEEVIEMQR